MSDHVNDEQWDSPGANATGSTDDDGVETIESYEADDGVVFYDAENPLAWVQASEAITLKEFA